MIGKSIEQLPTPALLIDEAVVERNLKRAAELAAACGKKLRPHIKTHKIPGIARRQMELGAVGICTAKVSEAEVMIRAGMKDVLIANEVFGRDKLERLAALARSARISVLADSRECVDGLGSAAQEHRVILNVLVEIDTGDMRCGIQPENAAELARRIQSWPFLRFGGIETFGGSVYHCSGKEEEQRLGRKVTDIMIRVKNDLLAQGIPVEEVSVGGSPAMALMAKEPVYTELRPGVYVFNDAATVSRGTAGYADCAATVLTTVISRPAKNRMVVDGGGKTFSFCRPGMVFGNRILHGVIKDRPDICLSGLSEEHGVFETETDLSGYHVGDKIQVIPAHVCPVINLFNKAWYVRDGKVTDEVSIEARGMTE